VVKIYLIKNEGYFKIFDTKGQAFEPDFVLFLQENGGGTPDLPVVYWAKGGKLKRTRSMEAGLA